MRSCEEYREMISAMLDGELPEAERAALEAHIASCAACAETYDAFAALTLPEEEVPETLHAGIMARVAPAQKALRGQRILARTRAWLTAAACLVFVVGTLFAVGRLALPRGAKSDGAAPAAEEPALCAGGDMVSGPLAGGTSGMIPQEKAETSAAGAVPAEAPVPAPAAAPAPASGAAATDAAMEEPAAGVFDANKASGEAARTTLKVAAWDGFDLTGVVTAADGTGRYAVGDEITVSAAALFDVRDGDPAAEYPVGSSVAVVLEAPAEEESDALPAALEIAPAEE